MRTCAFLKQVDEFLTPERFTQGALARTCDGESVGVNDSRAQTFCVYGAIFLLECRLPVSDYVYRQAHNRLNAACRALYGLDPAYVNDVLGLNAIKFALKQSYVS